MPSTINGIGTRYCGKKRLEKASSVCDHCNRPVDLETYETRLWFCFLYIPLIPLGRKQILDSCPACTWHRAVPLDEWDRLRSEAIDESAGNLKENQDDPEAGLQMMGTLAAFQKKGEATKLAKLLKEKHPDKANVQFSVAGWLEHVGEDESAAESFERAWQIEPKNHAYRRAWGMTVAQQGKLKEARELLSILEPGEENYDPGTMFFFTRQCQSFGDHHQALEVLTSLVEANPEFGADSEVRRLVKESESAVGAESSILPGQSVFKRAGLWWVAVAVLIIAGVVGSSLFIAANRTVYVVNGSTVPLTVSVDGGRAVQIPPISKRELPLSEGEHQWDLSEPASVAANGAFSVETGFFERLFSSPVFILDPGRTVVTVWEKARYAVDADNAQVQHQFYLGEDFYAFDDVDLQFAPFPASVKSDGAVVTRTRVESFLLEPAQVISFVANDLTPEQQLAFCERHLRITPQDEGMLDVYSRFAFQLPAHQRLHDFLEGGVGRRPVEIEWHRRYQAAAQRIGRDDEIVAEYDQLVSELPNDAAALYLRGRIEPSGTLAEELFDRAIAADGSNPYPFYAKCHRLVSLAKFTEARTAAERAIELRPENFDMENMLSSIRLALGEYESLEQEQRDVLRETPLNATAHFRLMAILAAQDRLAEMRQTHDEFTLAVKSELPLDPYDYLLSSERFVAYCNRDYERMLLLTRKLKNPAHRTNQMVEPLVSLGRVDELIESDLMESLTQRGFIELYISLAFLLNGDEENSRRWMENAITDFQSGGLETREIARVLKNETGDQLVNGLRGITLSSAERLLVSLAAATRAEGKTRVELLALADKLNFFPGFPNHFVRQVIALSGD